MNARCLLNVEHIDEPRPANHVATQSYERAVHPSRRCCHQSADLLARELAVWPVNAEVVASGRCCSKRRLRLLHQRPIVGYAVDRFFGPQRADGIAPPAPWSGSVPLRADVRLVLYTSRASPQHPIQDAQLVIIFLRISQPPFQSEFERLLHSSLVPVQLPLALTSSPSTVKKICLSGCTKTQGLARPRRKPIFSKTFV